MTRAMVAEVAFDVDGREVVLTEPEARILGERLFGFHHDQYMPDVSDLAKPSSGGVDPGWVAGGRSLFRRIEAVLSTAETGPVVIDANGEEGDAAFHALRLSTVVSSDATSGLNHLYHPLEDARRPTGWRGLLARLTRR